MDESTEKNANLSLLQNSENFLSSLSSSSILPTSSPTVFSLSSKNVCNSKKVSEYTNVSKINANNYSNNVYKNEIPYSSPLSSSISDVLRMPENKNLCLPTSSSSPSSAFSLYAQKDSSSSKNFNSIPRNNSNLNNNTKTNKVNSDENVNNHNSDSITSNQIYNSYLYGQLSNVTKAAVWWSMFGSLVMSILNNKNAVGFTRTAFNLALVLISPIAGVIAERCSIKLLLNVTTYGRMIIWSFLAPFAWIFLNNWFHIHWLFYGIFIGLMFCDGIQVAFANVVDIDCGGLDTLAHQYSLPMNDYLRNKYNGIHQIVFDVSFIIFTPPIAAIVWSSSKLPFLQNTSLFGENNGVSALMLGVSFVFLVLSVLSLFFYSGLGQPPRNALLRNGDGENENDFLRNNSSQRSVMQETMERLQDVKEGFLIILRERSLGWRLFFLAVETALEDSIVSVVIPEIALHTARLFAYENERALANFWGVIIIAVGKLGGCFAGFYMNTFWVPPNNYRRNSAYKTLFWCVLISSSSVLLFPLSRYLLDNYNVSVYLCGFLIFLGAFIFFAFSTAPKIGFATLFQGLVASQQVAGKVFGFVGTFVTIMDAIIISLINFIFFYFGFSHFFYALLTVAAIYLIHGLIEAFIGPLLILEPPNANSIRSFFYDTNQFPLASEISHSSQ